MKIAKYLFPAVILFLTVNCFSGKTVATNLPEENANQSIQTSASYEENRQAGANEQTSVQQNTPEALVKDLYKVHGQDFKSSADRILNGKNRAYLDKYFDKNLADLIWKDLTTHKDEVGVIDFDLFYNAQDVEIRNVAVGQAKIEGEKATVPVSFSNYNRKETLTYLLNQQNGVWKIHDIKYGKSDSLLKYFEQDAKSNAAYENFTGTFQVGNTTATVKRGDANFELRWAKGAGAMAFSFEGNDSGKYVFSSEDKGKGQDKFIFDDESLNTGKFVRADDKEMPVRKIK